MHTHTHIHRVVRTRWCGAEGVVSDESGQPALRQTATYCSSLSRLRRHCRHTPNSFLSVGSITATRRAGHGSCWRRPSLWCVFRVHGFLVTSNGALSITASQASASSRYHVKHVQGQSKDPGLLSFVDDDSSTCRLPPKHNYGFQIC
jgi:hypothetical protein